MKLTCRVLAVAVMAAGCCAAGERRVEDVKKDPKLDRSTSGAKHYDPKGQIKSSVDMRKAFEASAKGTKGGKEEIKTPPKEKDGAPPAAPPSAPKPPKPK